MVSASAPYKPYQTFTITDFRGLDLRSMPTLGDPHALIASDNVSINLAKEIEVRPQLTKLCDLDPLSRGLYASGGTLRTAIPWRPGLPAASGPVVYDAIDDKNHRWSVTTSYPYKRLTAVTSATSYDQRPYLVVAYDLVGGSGTALESGWEHHWLPASDNYLIRSGTFTNGSTQVVIPVPSTWTAPKTLTTATVRVAGAPTSSSLLPTTVFTGTVQVRPVGNPAAVVVTLAVPFDGPTGTYTARVSQAIDTSIAVPFTPGPAALVAASKVWASRRGTPDVAFSSTLNGPSDWTELEDAGFLPTSRNVEGQQEIQGLGIFNGQLTVFFKTSAQIWAIDPDPGKHVLVGSIGGAGCTYPRSVANVMGDLVYFSNGVFRVASSVITTGQKKEGDLGTMIAPLTRALSPDVQPLSVWSSYRQQYISFAGNTAYVATLSPESNVREWTTWTLPFEVAEVVELDQKLYVRRADSPEVWWFNPDETQEAGFRWSARLSLTDHGSPGQLKALQQVSMRLIGSTTLSVLLADPNLPPCLLGDVDSTQAEHGLVVAGDTAERFGWLFEGTEACRIGALSVRTRLGGLA